MTDIGNQAAPWMDIEEFTLAARGMVLARGAADVLDGLLGRRCLRPGFLSHLRFL